MQAGRRSAAGSVSSKASGTRRRSWQPRDDSLELGLLQHACSERDARIGASETEIDAQERALAGDRRPQLAGRHARATHILRGDINVVDDGDAIETEHANRRMK